MLFRSEMKEYHRRILEAASEYRNIVQTTVDSVRVDIETELHKYSTLERLRAYALAEIERRDNATALDYLKHIDDFRSYKDQD